MADPTFSPDINVLSSITDAVNSALKDYESAQSPTDKGNALRSLAQQSQRLASASTSPADAFSDFTFQPLANACVRVAISVGLFKHLSDTGPMSIDELSQKTGADIGLTARIVRALVAINVVDESQKGLYKHTPLSKSYVDDSKRSWAVWMWDVMITASTGIGSYFENHALSIPTDPKNAPFTWSHDEKDVDVFELVQRIGKFQLFKDAMSGSSTLCAEEAVATYRFDELVVSDGDVVLVDVGGNKGQTLQEIRSAYPNLKGRMVLQDLRSVLDGGAIAGLDADVQDYDFFKQTQPVEGLSLEY